MDVKKSHFKKRLSETKLLDDLDFSSSFRVSIECPTGGGKSYYLLDYMKEHGIPFIFATDTLLLGQCLAARHGLPFYCADCRDSYGSEQLITVYQHIPKFIRRDTTLIIDEAHSLVTDYSWKRENIEDVLTAGCGYKRIILLSGTSLYSADSFYSGMTVIKAIPEQTQTRELIIVNYEELIGGIVELTTALKRDGKTVVISLLDKSDKLPGLRKALYDTGVKKLAVINSVSKKKNGKDKTGETDIEVEGDAQYYKQLSETGKLDAEIIITTYRQGYDLRGDNYELIIAPSKNKHSYSDIVQMMNRFRDLPRLPAYFLTNAEWGEEKEFDPEEKYQSDIKTYTEMTAKVLEQKKRQEKSYREFKFDQLFDSDPWQKFIYPEYHINHHLIAYTVYHGLNKSIYQEMNKLKYILAQYSIEIKLLNQKMTMEIISQTEKKTNNNMKYTQKEIETAIEQFYKYFLNPQDWGYEAINVPVKTPLHLKIRTYYDELKSLNLSDDSIKGILIDNMGDTEKMNKVREILMIKYSQNVTMKFYRQLLLENFTVGEIISGAEVEERTNRLRKEVGLQVQKHNTAVEYFNKLFKTKRRNLPDSKKQGYFIEAQF